MLTLYLVSALQTEADIAKHGLAGLDGHYWKVGITSCRNPLNRDPSRYQEVFRAVPLKEAHARVLETAIARGFRRLSAVNGVREGLGYSAGLEAAASIFDFFVDELGPCPTASACQKFLESFPFKETCRADPGNWKVKKLDDIIFNLKSTVPQSAEEEKEKMENVMYYEACRAQKASSPTAKQLKWKRFFDLFESLDCMNFPAHAELAPMW